NVMPMAQHYANVESGKSLFWRAGWVADYPDPESFLNLFYSAHLPDDDTEKTYLNNVRYRSSVFDSLLVLALKTIDRDQRYELYKKADQQLIDDAVIMPLFYDENIRLLQPYVKNFAINAMEYRDFGNVYFDQSEMN
ncbi:MAG: ABC transporter substrate-binding protein, partial [Bacteroidia bacterium]|nr:ABC transporter substrate-binding protein [Bacteroidia bacterium]